MEDDDESVSREYSYSDPVDPTISFFYRPHTLSLLFLMISGLVYLAFSGHGPEDVVTCTKLGLSVGALVFLLIGMLEFKDGPFIRPHPALWRVVLAMSVLYQIVLIFILFQNKFNMRKMLNVFDPTMGYPLPEKSYAESCEINFENIYNQMDLFVLAHFFGWFAKALILRDYWFCWILSVLFELLEYSLQHQLPNFAECWWDHWILDLILMNWAGTYIGMKTCEYFEMKHYSWRGINSISSYRGKVKRTFQQFTPHSWTKFEWRTTTTFKNFVAVIMLLYLVLQCELNAFYLKYLLWIPADHPLNVWRLALYFMMSLPAVREGYQFLTDKKCKRLGMHAWMGAANILVETLIIIKFGNGEFSQPAPAYVLWSWTIGIIVLILYAAWKFWYLPVVRGILPSEVMMSGNSSRAASRSPSPDARGEANDDRAPTEDMDIPQPRKSSKRNSGSIKEPNNSPGNSDHSPSIRVLRQRMKKHESLVYK